MRRSWFELGARMVRCVYRALIGAGSIWVHVPEDAPPHPRDLERVRPDIPLSAVERAMDHQLSDIEL
ncbi:hypothetical protein EDD93_1521 [Streptomyces sp. 840.1]|uniref:DUF6059 family protein n=1 Tax=unclassified Streptomyces TaxID=2593676 RepID=UPI000FB1D525|nr:DUF6059 family protein [Streptomyces sp. 840.1]ROQ67103.1 hypothetical protein EDD93_1521 [Streptomyces sp. 840.1]